MRFGLLVTVMAVVLGTGAEARPPLDFAAAPEGFIPPRLHPKGAELQTRELGPGVYALVSTKPGVDNSGFIVGERGVLVIDGHINGAMAKMIQDAVRKVTDKPILYVVNTNYHGDHTFGNYAFPPETAIVASRATADAMDDFEHEKKFLLSMIDGDASVVEGVEWRLPDIRFRRFLSIDLGGRVVELHHFGPGNTRGDTVVFEPNSRVTWTGNLVVGQGTIPLLLEGRAGRYTHTIARFAETLDVSVIIPGHGRPTTGAILGRYLDYLGDLTFRVRAAVSQGKTLAETLAEVAIADRFVPPADVPADSVPARIRALLIGFHRYNVHQTWLDLTDPEPKRRH
jgi:cyclase